jgi:hypothetical protein
MTVILPVRPTPRRSEPLTSYAARLADANGVSRAWVLLPWRHDIDVPKTELSKVAALAGLDASAAYQLTMDRYPLAVRGHGVQRRHGWRLHNSVTWICPSCTLATGHTELLWQTALMPVCRRCRCYLTTAGSPHLVRPAASPVLELVGILNELAEASVCNLGPRRVLYRLRRRCQLTAAGVVDEQPARGQDLPPVDVDAARAWGVYPSGDPATVAAILVLAGGHLVGRSHPKVEGERPGRSTGFLGFTPDDQHRLVWLLTRIRRHTARDGLRPNHIPTTLPIPADVNEPLRPGQWLSRARAATALRMLLNQALDQDSSPATALTALGIPDIPTGSLIDGLNTWQALRRQDSDLLNAGLDAILEAGLVDYQRRRDTLRAVTRLPTGPARRLPGIGSAAYPGDQLALGWIWRRFTHGPMRSSRWPNIPDRNVHTFGIGLDPEACLVLHDVGQQLLADADLTTIPMARATLPGVTRRYG